MIGPPVRLLFHSYHFPPIGGSGAQRPLKMVRYLHEFGYEPVVVTGGGATADRWAPEDATLVSEVPSDVEVHRVAGSPPPETSGRWRGRAERWLGVTPPWASWWIEGSTELGRDAAQDVDLIYVWMQPYVSAEAGAALSLQLGKPWVADLGDPWALDEMMVYPSALHRRRDLRRMGALLRTASAIVMSTPEAAHRLVEAFPELAEKHVVAIPNGFDASDFASTVSPRADDRFRLVHTGYLHTELGRQLRQTRALRRVLRGSVPGLDILTRSHVFILEAIDRLFRRDRDAADLLEFHLAGVLTEPDREVAARSPAVRLLGYKTHAESIELIRTADLLFLPMQNLPPGVRATIVPGKTYEYLASGTPILGAVPDGDARDILSEAGNATLCRPDDVEALTNALAEHLERFRSDAAPLRPNPAVVARFEYRHLARQLADVFDSVLGRAGRERRAV
jgi:glycosyltransferase involved in cell wall biosynthesis